MSKHWPTVYIRANQDRRVVVERLNTMARTHGLPLARPVSKAPTPSMDAILGFGTKAIQIDPRLEKLWTQDQATVGKKPIKQARKKAAGKVSRKPKVGDS